MKNTPLSGSFRDPSGFVFLKDGSIYRQVNLIYRKHYDHLMATGLYGELAGEGLLVPHEEMETREGEPGESHRTIRPELVPFISYPYEWCFSQFKEAALLTLEIQKRALGHDMSLKDASAYNVQFKDGMAIFIDTLSFEKYEEGRPWVAYRQFCQHFLAPLSLMSLCDIRLGRLMQNFIDGVPLDLAGSLLPVSSKFRPSLLAHVHMHAWSQKHYGNKKVDTSSRKVGKFSLLGLIDNLEASIRRLDWRPAGMEWSDYYDDTNYSRTAFEDKSTAVAAMLEQTRPSTVLDLGANTGVFSRLAAKMAIRTVSTDADPSAVEKNYRKCREDGEKNLLPLVVDLTNPSPSIGWDNSERSSWHERGPFDTVMVLALIHHLSISNNLPFYRLAEYFSGLCSHLIIEFVPRDDSQVQRLLRTREGGFEDYGGEMFEREFERYFKILLKWPVKGSNRSIYLMRESK